MSEKISDEVFDTLPKKPNFLLVIILSGVALVVVLLGALIFLSDAGKRIFPNMHHKSQPTSRLTRPYRDKLPDLGKIRLSRNDQSTSS